MSENETEPLALRRVTRTYSGFLTARVPSRRTPARGSESPTRCRTRSRLRGCETRLA